VNDRTCRARHAQNAGCELERVHRERVRNAQCAMRLRAADMLAVQFVSVNELGGIVEIVLQYVGFALEPCGAARAMRDFQVAYFACVAVDAACVQHAAHRYRAMPLLRQKRALR
jgi:hypothetical protein